MKKTRVKPAVYPNPVRESENAECAIVTFMYHVLEKTLKRGVHMTTTNDLPQNLLF